MALTVKAKKILSKHHGDGRSRGERYADAVVENMGSWRFIVIQTGIVTLWIIANLVMVFGLKFDPYPFILLNLLFSTQAAYASPLILMSGNRGAARDHDFAAHQFEEIELIKKVLDENTELTTEVHSALVKH